MKQAFNELVMLVQDEHTVSAYELCTSGLVQALYSTLSVSLTDFHRLIHQVMPAVKKFNIFFSLRLGSDV